MMIMMKSFSPKFEKDYCPDLLSWKELSDLVNQTQLMTQERIKVNFPEEYAKSLSWPKTRWCLDDRAVPAVILKDIIEREGNEFWSKIGVSNMEDDKKELFLGWMDVLSKKN